MKIHHGLLASSEWDWKVEEEGIVEIHFESMLAAYDRIQCCSLDRLHLTQEKIMAA